MEKLKVGIIGTGHLGKLHVKMFKQISECEVAGIFDSNSQTAKVAAREFNTKAFDNLDDLLNEIRAASIAVNTTAHHEIAKRCMEKGVHIFVEKPITASISEAEELVQLSSDRKLNLQVGHIERFNPAIISLEKFIFEPMFIQTDRLAQFNPRGTDVAVVLDLMIHDIDIILSLIKSEVKNIEANGVAVVSNNLDIANARIEFENGAVANVTASRISQKKLRKMRIFQRDAYISLDFITGVSEVYRLLPIDQNPESTTMSFGEIGIGEKRKRLIYEQPEIKDVNALKYELELFIKSILYKSNPVVSGMDGLRALKVADIIMDKIAESQKKFN
ncbi:MAG: oxidoreductase [Ignavibacteria bacterium RIFOXYB2_FULL_35_12]|nr:MAG: oxidoreductase [Ignavibacteria bacterium GWA2_36_19]OGU52940.1 MAG: oxidoreductase [Ignavibacteria bacterium GWC2_35_8]OGU62301.1 MAG: oxidoreductase [Ignavibacteria bacterium GWF2_35_20]OGU79161.1 MAG: oxidoreductase [Ignavibacteria bacterium RIFOXYA2_FULL_35_9]OGU82981.1 MAG: oxidoreductase [Ignavibacteria bacterium RBG_16_35_7]OGU86174.1 MAG: oxidoreductase [Ignavibacteria bacterium RIFOXYA12_FULL_35_25]OGU92964.1 MAG: oxidoreductase [Ignavibacteria bacterium RIFOXYB12_FULL_35_14]